MKGIRGLLIKDLCLMGEIRKLLLIILFVTAIFIFNGTSSTFGVFDDAAGHPQAVCG